MHSPKRVRRRRARHGRPPVRRGPALTRHRRRWQVDRPRRGADAAYDRVGLTGYTEHWDRTRLALPGNDYAGDDRVEVVLRDTVTAHRPGRASTSRPPLGRRITYDTLVLATGSYAFVPPVPGHDLPRCHVYRTLDDLDAIRADVERATDASVTGRRRHRRRAAGTRGRQCVARLRVACRTSWRWRRG